MSEVRKTAIVDTEYRTITTDVVPPQLEGFSEKETQELKDALKHFLKSYSAKDSTLSDEEWLAKELHEALPDESDESIQELSRGILQGVKEWDENVKSLQESVLRGKKESEWLADKLQDAAVGVSVADYGNYLSQIDNVLTANNQALMDTILTQSNTINMNPNLDGFLAEQEIVNSFNREAALVNSPYRAEALKPQLGDTYGKNSVDIVIRDTRKEVQNIVRRYQAKFGGDAEKTASYLLGGDYRGQRALVPQGQKQAVENILANAGSKQMVSDYIESPDGVRSNSFSKEQVEQHRDRVQDGKNLRQETWTTYNTKALAMQIGKEAAFAGVAGAALGTGFYLAEKAWRGEKITADDAIEVALTTGADAGVKAAATGALTAVVRRGVISFISKSTSVGILATVASVGIENAKIAGKYVSGEISGKEALDRMARTSVAMTAGIGHSMLGVTYGAAIGSVVPVVGTVVGGFIGGTVGYIAGSKIGNAVYSGVKKVASVAKKVATSAWNGVKSVGRSVKNFFRSIFD